ncbi:IclR family transcriptional regulator [Nocardioides hungaricus]
MTDDSVAVPATPGVDRAGNLLTSTQKALALLETMASVGRPAGVSELARIVGASRGTVHKQLSTLVASGWVEQHGDGRYALSLLATRIGNAALRQAGLGDKIQQILEAVVAESGECATVAALQRDSALIVQRAESDQVLNANIRVGTVIPLHTGASSQVLVAFATSAEQRELWRRAGIALPSETALEAIRAAGWAVTTDEFLPGVTALSVPVRDELTLRTIALTLVAPKHRVDPERALPVLLAARAEIEALGSGAPVIAARA